MPDEYESPASGDSEPVEVERSEAEESDPFGAVTRQRAPDRQRVAVVVPDGVDAWTYIPEEYVGHPIAPNAFCRAWNGKREKYCGSKAGHGTTHPGEGRCRTHEGRPVTTGRSVRYHDLHHRTIGDLVKKFQDDPDPLNILDELALARALLVDFVNRYAEFVDALLDWHSSFKLTKMPLSQEDADGYIRVVTEYAIMLKEGGEYTDLQIADCTRAERFIKAYQRPVPEGRPRKVVEITEARHVIDSIVKIVGTLNERSTVTEAEVSRMISGMSRVVDVHVTDPDTRRRIRESWVKLVTR